VGLLDTVRWRLALSIMPKQVPEGPYDLLTRVFMFGQPPPRGSRELLIAYKRLPWLRAALSRIANAVASTDWELFQLVPSTRNERFIRQKQERGLTFRPSPWDDALPKMQKKIVRSSGDTRQKLLRLAKQLGNLVEVEDHPFLDFLHGGNPVIEGRTSRLITQVYLDLVGDAYWVLERDPAGRPMEYWPIPTTWVVERPTSRRPVYRVGYRGWEVEIPYTEVLWMRDPDPENPYGIGTGFGWALGDELETDEYTAKHLKTWFYNRAVPELLIGVESGTEAQLRQAQERWEAQHQGFQRAYRTHWFRGKLSVTQLSQTFQNQQLVELRKFERDTIISVLGVPPEILGIIESSNRATIDVSNYLFARWVVQPRLEFWRTQLQERILPEFSEDLILNYGSPIPEDTERMLRAARIAPWALTRNEWREILGYDPDPRPEYGDVYYVPQNLVAEDANARAEAEEEGIRQLAIRTINGDPEKIFANGKR